MIEYETVVSIVDNVLYIRKYNGVYDDVYTYDLDEHAAILLENYIEKNNEYGKFVKQLKRVLSD